MDLAAFDWTIYWFMFPVSIVIATTAMLSSLIHPPSPQAACPSRYQAAC